MFNITVIGVGYIGLVMGIALSEFGNKVIFADIDSKKIDKLKNGEIPIYEPGLEDLLKKNIQKNIEFTTNVASAIKSSQIIFIAVNTPTGKDERADISAVKNVAQTISDNLNEDKIVCIKSTVPIGTHKIIDEIIKSKNKSFNVEIVSIPEFLREGTALNDFVNPDRIVIGTKSEKAYKTIKKLFKPTKCSKDKIVWTDNAAAETIKYVSNSFLAMKVSFINEIANFCDQNGVDTKEVVKGVGLDHRIGSHFLNPGPGFGGSCFPKDVLALLKMSQDSGNELELIKATLLVNDLHKKRITSRIKTILNNDLNGKTIAILGLAFKANTDDIRYSPAIDIIKELKKQNMYIKAYDPEAMNNMKTELPDIIYCNDPYEALKNADLALLLTEWNEFKNLDFYKIHELMNNKIIFDTRNILDFNHLKEVGFIVDSIGRSAIAKNELNENYLETPVANLNN